MALGPSCSAMKRSAIPKTWRAFRGPSGLSTSPTRRIQLPRAPRTFSLGELIPIQSAEKKPPVCGSQEPPASAHPPRLFFQREREGGSSMKGYRKALLEVVRSMCSSGAVLTSSAGRCLWKGLLQRICWSEFAIWTCRVTPRRSAAPRKKTAAWRGPTIRRTVIHYRHARATGRRGLSGSVTAPHPRPASGGGPAQQPVPVTDRRASPLGPCRDGGSRTSVVWASASPSASRAACSRCSI
jgi:hypothetical protein